MQIIWVNSLVEKLGIYNPNTVPYTLSYEDRTSILHFRKTTILFLGLYDSGECGILHSWLVGRMVTACGFIAILGITMMVLVIRVL